MITRTKLAMLKEKELQQSLRDVDVLIAKHHAEN